VSNITDNYGSKPINRVESFKDLKNRPSRKSILYPQLKARGVDENAENLVEKERAEIEKLAKINEEAKRKRESTKVKEITDKQNAINRRESFKDLKNRKSRKSIMYPQLKAESGSEDSFKSDDEFKFDFPEENKVEEELKYGQTIRSSNNVANVSSDRISEADEENKESERPKSRATDDLKDDEGAALID
jgi:hypothetical protein